MISIIVISMGVLNRMFLMMLCVMMLMMMVGRKVIRIVRMNWCECGLLFVVEKICYRCVV